MHSEEKDKFLLSGVSKIYSLTRHGYVFTAVSIWIDLELLKWDELLVPDYKQGNCIALWFLHGLNIYRHLWCGFHAKSAFHFPDTCIIDNFNKP